MKNFSLSNQQILIGVIIAILLVTFFLYFIYHKSTPGSNSTEEVKVYFSKLVGTKVVTEPVSRKIVKGQRPINQAMAELINGPTEEEKDKGFYTEIPEGTRIIKIRETPEEVRINLNDQFISGGGSESMQSRLNEVIDTALDTEPVRKVYLDVEGEPLETLGGEGVEVPQPLQKPEPENAPANDEM